MTENKKTEKQRFDETEAEIEQVELESIGNKKEFVVTSMMSMLLGKKDGEIKQLLNQFEDKSELLVHRYMEKMYFNGSFLVIQGTAYFPGFPESDKYKISKKLILSSRSEEVEPIEIPLRNSKLATADARFPLGGYEGEVDFQKISEGSPLAIGDYTMKIEVSQYIKGEWRKQTVSLGKLAEIKGNYVHSTTMQSYSARSNKKFKLTVSYNGLSEEIKVVSKKLSDVNPLDQLEGGEVTEGRLMRALKRKYFKLFYKFYCTLPVSAKKVAFLSDSRTDITGNFEYIYEELKKRGTDHKISFYLKGSIKQPKSLKELRTLAQAIATSKYVLVDDFYPLIYPLKIRKDSELIQVWHAVGAFKTFGYSRVGMPGGPKITSLNHRNYTRVLVSSTNIVDKYAEGFGIAPETVMPIGAPRTDLFFDEAKKAAVIERLKEELPFINGKKVILFAPTFRGNGQQSAHYPFGMIDFKQIYEALKDEYVFLLKIHPFVQNKPEIPYEYNEFYYDVSAYREINDLLLISDQLITDYSSVCFEYALLDKPMVFFSPDLGEYMSDRDFYYDYFDFIPGSFASNTPTLIEKLQQNKIDHQRLEIFKNYYFDDLDGKASERFVDLIVNDAFETAEEVVEEEIIWGRVK